MSDKFRMIQWLGFAGIFYALAMWAFGGQPQLQTLCWKLGNLTVASFAGYHIDVHAFRKHITPYSTGVEQIRRAIIMAAAMLSVSLGL